MTDSSEDRRRVHYSGRVQGVGFRMTAARIARNHPVRGFVRNLPDGRVELIAVGERGAVRSFLDAVAERFEGHIRASLEEEDCGTEEFAAFEVRR